MTAVEWLVEQLNKQGFAQVVTDEEIQQAKEMEKQQLKEMYLKGIENYDPTFKRKI
jgi:predicted GNAT family acetyltransferase